VLDLNVDDGDDAEQPPRKSRKPNFLRQTGRGPTTHAVFWPHDLLPQSIPDARVLTYGYDTNIRHWAGPTVNKSTIYDIAWDFLVALEANRRNDPSRPLLFVVHSLGGIVIKEMLRRSSGCQLGQSHLHQIFESTTGIMFFGTPHSGADPLGFLQRTIELVATIAGFSAPRQIVNTLLPSSGRLRELRDEFVPMAQREGWVIHSFQEQQGLKALNGSKVVEDTSSYLHSPAIEITEHIMRNHMDMCRFAGPDDVEYKKVVKALQRMVSSVNEHGRTRRRRAAAAAQGSALGRKRMLLEMLRFDQIDARERSIKKAHAKSCKWFLTKPEYLHWLDIARINEHYGFLWIKGKPGTGKSTLMKYIFENAKRTMHTSAVLSFFFNARGEMLERSTVGLFRSLIVQILERIPETEHGFDALSIPALPTSIDHWSVEMLKELFGHVVQMCKYKGPIICFIDALDECEEMEVREMISYFEYLGELCVSVDVQFQVCFSSRHYPHITQRFGLSLVLEGQEGHDEDIANYLNKELRIGSSRVAEEVRAEVQEKSSGVFMWVFLVVNILNKEYDDGNIHALRQKLRQIPAKLHELFRDILTRDSLNTDRLVLCIQWVMFARKPLRPEELYFAILSGIQPDILESWNAEDVTQSDIEKFLLSSSKGLVEVTKSKVPTVQYIHESVRDFLLKERGIGEIWSELQGTFEGKSHDMLRQCCVNYVNIAALRSANNEEAAVSAENSITLRDEIIRAYPFVRYAVENLFFHADQAHGAGVSQKAFLETFQLSRWISVRNALEKYPIRRYSSTVSMLYVLAENDSAHLIRCSTVDNGSYLKVEQERYGLPLFASLATGSMHALRAFLESEIDTPSRGLIQDPGIAIGKICETYDKGSAKSRTFGRDFQFWKGSLQLLSPEKCDILTVLKDDEDLKLVLFLFDRQRVKLGDSWIEKLLLRFIKLPEASATAMALLELIGDTEIKRTMSQILFRRAIFYEDQAVASALISDVALNEADSYGRTPLYDAAFWGVDGIVMLILETGLVDLSLRDKWHPDCLDRDSPIYAAAQRRHIGSLKLLLRAHKSQMHYWTPLHDMAAASSWVNYDIRTIIESCFATEELDGSETDKDGRTALWYAIDKKSSTDAFGIATWFMKHSSRIDPCAEDKSGVSPLGMAEERARSVAAWEKVVSLLRTCSSGGFEKSAVVSEKERCALDQ